MNKVEKIKKLADAMYYAAQMMSTDASHLKEAMEKWWQFKNVELKESKDERIRERLIEFFKDWGKTRSHCWSISISDILAWLEKRDEQKPDEDRYMEGYLNGINDASKTLKPTAWSEEDDIMKQHCHQMLALLRPNSSELTKDIIDNCHHWLKSLRPQNTWSPSDGELECLGYAIEKAKKDWSPLTNNRIYLTLKALKEQLKKLREE